MRGEIEFTLRRIQQTSTELLSQLDKADDTTAEALRSEINRLNGLGFTIVRLLAHDDLLVAYHIVTGAPDEDGTVLGVAV